MKYIDAEKLSTQIEKIFPDSSDERTVEGFEYALDKVKAIIDSLQQEQPEQKKNCAECPYCIDRHDQSGWHFKGCFGGPYKGKFIAEIDECPLQQEQPEVDLNFQVFAKEMDAVFNLPKEVTENTEENPLNWEYEIARHFAKWGAEHLKK